MASDSEVDALFEAPLAEFTSARNALAKARGGAAGAAIKALQKPSVPAWAVNQLYWRRRDAYDVIVTASEARRAAHAKVLAGKKADLAAAEQAWQEAMRKATSAVREVIERAGEAATPATMVAVTETLQALPADGPPGRLTRPLKPAGFEALAGLRISGRPGKVPAAAPPASPSVTVVPSATSKQAAATRKRERAAIEKALKAARTDEKAAGEELAKAQTGLDRAQAERERLQDQLQFALKQIQDRRDDISRLDLRVREAAAERERLEARLREA